MKKAKSEKRETKSEMGFVPRSFSEGGFTLIELLAAVGVFAVVVTITSATFIVSMKGQRKSFTVQNVADNVRYAAEVMAKELRMMDVDPGRLFNVDDNNGACAGINCRILFYSNMPNRASAAQLVFYLEGERIMFDDDISAAPPAGAITASNVRVTSFEFAASGAPPTSQPRITIVIQAVSAGAAEDVETRIDLQTTVSPRTL